MNSPEDEFQVQIDQLEYGVDHAEILSQTGIDLLNHITDMSRGRRLGETEKLGDPLTEVTPAVGSLGTEDGSPIFEITLMPKHRDLTIKIIELYGDRLALFKIDRHPDGPLLSIPRHCLHHLNQQEVTLILGSANRQIIARVLRAAGSL